MKLRPPRYDGDSFLWSGSEEVAVVKEGNSTPDMVRCTTPHAVGRIHRGDGILHLARTVVRAIGHRIGRVLQHSDDTYLARAKTLGELEDRMRHLERQGGLSRS